MSTDTNIPKIIHYCWFGRNKKDKLVLKCMETWKKHFPGYEIKEWNEDNFDISIIPYTKEAYICQKWAFVSDYARLFVIYHYGGIYFDTDVEVRRNFSHLLIKYGYLGFENTTNNVYLKTVNTGLGFAAAAGDFVIKALMDDYENLHFINEKGEMDLTPCPIRNTNVLKRMGLQTNGYMQQIGNIIIYPFEYFCGVDIANNHKVITDNTYTIHHYNATWKDDIRLGMHLKYKVLIPCIQKLIGIDNYVRLKRRIKG